MLTQAHIQKLFSYDKKTGLLTRKTIPTNRTKAGDIAGSVSHGYLSVCINYKKYPVHRLIWLHVYGYFPEHEIDHKNGISADNRLQNLREISHACNMQNRQMHQNNSSGFPGVSWCKMRERWRAEAHLLGKKVALGSHDSALDAALARLTWETQCPFWSCDERSVLIKQIKISWPEFRAIS